MSQSTQTFWVDSLIIWLHSSRLKSSISLSVWLRFFESTLDLGQLTESPVPTLPETPSEWHQRARTLCYSLSFCRSLPPGRSIRHGPKPLSVGGEHFRHIQIRRFHPRNHDDHCICSNPWVQWICDRSLDGSVVTFSYFRGMLSLHGNTYDSPNLRPQIKTLSLRQRPSLEQRNSFWLQGQPSSSLPSLQSGSPSHLKFALTQSPLAHTNWGPNTWLI